jgi:hypothetical protein
VSGAQARTAGPGAVKVRLLGELSACSTLAALLSASATVDVASADGPYANRREPGGRLYLTVRARAAGAVRPEVRFDLSDGETYFVLTEALLDFAARERSAADPSRVRLAEVADAVLALIDAALSPSPVTIGKDESRSKAPAAHGRNKWGPGGSHPPGPRASISSRSPLDA